MDEVQALPSMAIRLVIFSDLRRFLPDGHNGQFDLSVPDGSTVVDLIAASGLSLDPELDLRAGINGDSAALDTVLSDRDEVVLFGPMEGG